MAALWLLEHDTMLVQRRDEAGRPVKPHVVDWWCHRCERLVGATELGGRWALLARLRRQALALRKIANG